MDNRLLIAGSAAIALIVGLTAAFAAESAGALDQLSLTGAVAPVAKLNVPCAGPNAFTLANGSPSDACSPTTDALFPASLASAAPIAVLSGTNDAGALDIKLTDALSLNLGAASIANAGLTDLTPFTGSLQEAATRPLAQASFAGVRWNVMPWASLSLIAAQSTDNDPFDRQGLSSLAKSSQSISAGASARLGDNWVTTVSYDQGSSELNLRSASLLGDDDLLHSRALGLSIAKRGLFGNNDSLDIGISRKLQSYTPNINFGTDDGFGNSLPGNNLAMPGTDFEVGYVTTFDGGLALQANVGYQTNVAGQNDKNALTVLSRAKFNF